MKRNRKTKITKKQLEHDIVMRKHIENNINMNIKRYNELMVKISDKLGIKELGDNSDPDPNLIFQDMDISDEFYELNKIHGILFRESISRTVMEYIPDYSKLNQGKKMDWRKYWAKKRRANEFKDIKTDLEDSDVYVIENSTGEIYKITNSHNKGNYILYQNHGSYGETFQITQNELDTEYTYK